MNFIHRDKGASREAPFANFFCLKLSRRCNMIVKIDKMFIWLMGDF